MIYVLEDMEVRVRSLEEVLGPTVEVRWAETVKDFLKMLGDGSDATLVILDHDLGGIPLDLDVGSRDPDGLTGMDAVYKMPVVDCPVLVWSFNSLRAPQMRTELRKRGMKSEWMPFGSHQCTATLTNVRLQLASRYCGAV